MIYKINLMNNYVFNAFAIFPFILLLIFSCYLCKINNKTANQSIGDGADAFFDEKYLEISKKFLETYCNFRENML